MIVVDTNIIAYFYIPGQSTKSTELLMQKDPAWQVPYLWRSELRKVLSIYLRQKYLTLEKVLRIMSDAEKFFDQHEYLVDSHKLFDLVSLSSCSAYDCEFVALAYELKVPLITTDQKILKDFPSISQSIDQFLS